MNTKKLKLAAGLVAIAATALFAVQIINAEVKMEPTKIFKRASTDSVNDALELVRMHMLAEAENVEVDRNPYYGKGKWGVRAIYVTNP